MTWEDIITDLMASGHRWADIKTYTLDQMILFYTAAIKSRISYMLDIRLAVWAGKEDLSKYIAAIGRR